MNEASSFITLINKLIDVEFNNNAEANGIVVRKLVTIASVNEEANTATVYFQGDNETQSTPYANMTGCKLEVGDKVYLFHTYGNPTKGWLMLHTTAQPIESSGLSYEIIMEI